MRWSERQRERGRLERDREASKDLRAQRLSFVAGSLLAWGTTFIGLHAFLRTLQAPSARELYFGDPAIDHAFEYDSVHFVVVSYLVGFGLSMVFIASLYLIDHGLSLRGSASRSAQAISPTSQFLYDSLLALLAIIALSALLGLPTKYGTVALDRVLVLDFGLQATGAAVGAQVMVAIVWGIACVAAARIWLGKDGAAKLSRMSERFGERAGYVIAIGLFCALVIGVFATVAVETAFTAELATNKRAYDRRTDQDVEVALVLGGATSDPDRLVLTLESLGQDRVRRALKADLVAGPGRYVALVPIAQLPAGRYRIALRYPRKTSLPFVNWTLEREVSISVGP